MYRVTIWPSAGRDLSTLGERASGHDVERLRSAIRSLAEQPRPHGVQKIRGEEKAYRIRVGNYRVIYEVHDKGNVVFISRVLRRTETTYRA